MAWRLEPTDGDVVVREHRYDGACTYVLRTIPGADQLTIQSYQHAITQALAFAARKRVRAWLEHADGTVEPLRVEQLREHYARNA